MSLTGSMSSLGRISSDTNKQVGRWQQVSAENIKKFYETIARIISEREQVKVTVQVREKEAAA